MCEVGAADGKTGDVKQVKILGTWAMIDDGETDWKILVIDVTDPKAAEINNADDLEKAYPGAIKKTFEVCSLSFERVLFIFFLVLERLQDSSRIRTQQIRIQRRVEGQGICQQVRRRTAPVLEKSYHGNQRGQNRCVPHRDGQHNSGEV